MHGEDPGAWITKMVEAHRTCGAPLEVELYGGR